MARAPAPVRRRRRGPEEQKQIAAIAQKLYECFVACDAMLCEINPLIVKPDGAVHALDSKFTVDDNALYRHPDIAEMRDLDAYPPEERAARAKDVTYVKLDGEVGILGNGAGLVMSTLDVVGLAGGRAANFCDLGGGGDAQGVVDALEVIVADPQVKSILFNVFGGITRCDEVARGILQALSQMTIELPIVVRLDGTNAEEGRRLLAEAAPANLHVEPTMLDAARRAVELAKHDRSVWSARQRRTATATRIARGPTSTWSSSGPPGETALDVATGGGHVARRLREAGLQVVTVDPRPGMQADVHRRAEDLPVRRRELRHRRSRASPRITSTDVGSGHARAGARRAARRPHRGRRSTVDEAVEEAERLRDPTHVRCYSEDEWRALLRGRPG